MADGLTTQSTTLATVPDSTKIATDDAGAAGHVQVVKLAIATDGSATFLPGDATDGLLVNLGANNDVTASFSVDAQRLTDDSAGLTIASTAYTSGDQLGTILEFTNAASSSGGFGRIMSATLLDDANVLGAVDLFLFSQSVTLASDNAAYDFSDADMANFRGLLSFPPPTQSASNGVATLPTSGLVYSCAATSLFGALVTKINNPVFAAADDIHVSLMVERF